MEDAHQKDSTIFASDVVPMKSSSSKGVVTPAMSPAMPTSRKVAPKMNAKIWAGDQRRSVPGRAGSTRCHGIHKPSEVLEC